jgi:SepF-like predicted cell division protein (DUF552 family)
MQKYSAKERNELPGLGDMFRKPKKVEKENEAKPPDAKSYLKAMPLRDLSDLETIKNEVKSGNIVILRIVPLASKSIDDVRQAINDLSTFAETIGGDIARLGEERVVICPPNIRIWRERTSVSSEPIPTAA